MSQQDGAGDKPLKNPRHEQFAQLVASGKKPAEAFVAVGFSPVGAASCAKRLLRTASVAARFEHLQNTVAQSAVTRALIDRDFVLQNLKENLLMAIGKMDAPTGDGKFGRVYNPGAVAQTARLLGLELGMFRESTDHTFKWDGDVTKLTQQQLDTLLASLSARLFGDDQAARAAAEKEALEQMPPTLQ